MKDDHLSLEQRVARLESALGWTIERQSLPFPFFITALLISLASIAALFLGLGFPNHPYQIILACIAILIAYHRGWLLRSHRWFQFVLMGLNVVQLTLLLKLFIGSGTRKPFFWAKYPILSKVSDGKWFETFNLAVSWQPSSLAGWEVDLTMIQTFLLLATLIGTLFRFQPFASLTAFLLVLVSIPAFASFNWMWLFPAITLSALAFYLQTPGPRREMTLRRI